MDKEQLKQALLSGVITSEEVEAIMAEVKVKKNVDEIVKEPDYSGLGDIRDLPSRLESSDVFGTSTRAKEPMGLREELESADFFGTTEAASVSSLAGPVSAPERYQSKDDVRRFRYDRESDEWSERLEPREHFKAKLLQGLKDKNESGEVSEQDVEYTRNFITTRGKVIYFALRRLRNYMHGHGRRYLEEDDSAEMMSIAIFSERYGNIAPVVLNKFTTTLQIQKQAFEIIQGKLATINDEEQRIPVYGLLPSFIRHKIIQGEIEKLTSPELVYMSPDYWEWKSPNSKLNVTLRIKEVKQSKNSIEQYGRDPQQYSQVRGFIGDGVMRTYSSFGDMERTSAEDRNYWTGYAKEIKAYLAKLEEVFPQVRGLYGDVYLQFEDQEMPVKLED